MQCKKTNVLKQNPKYIFDFNYINNYSLELLKESAVYRENLCLEMLVLMA